VQTVASSIRDGHLDGSADLVAVIRRAINERPFAILGVYSSSRWPTWRSPERHPEDQRPKSCGVRRAPQHLPDVLQPAVGSQARPWLVKSQANKIALIYVNNAFGRGAARCS